MVQAARADRLRSLAELACGLRIFLAGIGGETIEIALEFADLAGHLRLPFLDPAHLFTSLCRIVGEAVHLFGEVTLLLLKSVYSIHRLLRVLTDPALPGAIEAPLGFGDLLLGPCGFRRAGVASLRSGPPHGIGRLLQLACGFLELPVVGFTGEALQLTRGFLGFVGEFSLALSTPAAATLLTL